MADSEKKTEFDSHFVELQKDLFPLKLPRKNKPSDRLRDLIKVCQPKISAHGFSFRWSEEFREKDLFRVSCIISGYGYEEESFVDIPGQSKTDGKLRALCNAFGIIFDSSGAEKLGPKSKKKMSFADYTRTLNSHVPSSERSGWMKRAMAAIPEEALWQLSQEIRDNYGSGAATENKE